MNDFRRKHSWISQGLLRFLSSSSCSESQNSTHDEDECDVALYTDSIINNSTCEKHERPCFTDCKTRSVLHHSRNDGSALLCSPLELALSYIAYAETVNCVSASDQYKQNFSGRRLQTCKPTTFCKRIDWSQDMPLRHI